MATHSNILAWRIPWTEEAGGLQSMWSQRVNTTEQLNHHHHHQDCLNILLSSLPPGYRLLTSLFSQRFLENFAAVHSVLSLWDVNLLQPSSVFLKDWEPSLWNTIIKKASTPSTGLCGRV